MFLKFIPRESRIEYGKSSFDFDKLSFFTYSRDAIYSIVEEIGINENDNVIIPNYICGTVIEVLYKFTKNIKLYQLDNKLKFDEYEIKKLVCSKTKMILFVDYFGVEAKVSNDLFVFLNTHDVILLKDSAHSFLTLLKNDFKFAPNYDYLVSSIYKNIYLHVGAVAIGKFKNKKQFVSNKILVKRKLISSVKSIFCYLGFSLINRNIEELMIVNNNYIKFREKNNCYHSYVNKLSKLDFNKIILTKDKLSLEYFEYFKHNSVFTLEEIKNSSLQAFPIWCGSKENRDKILSFLRKKNVDAYTWPVFYENFVNEQLWSRILLIPIDSCVLDIIKKEI